MSDHLIVYITAPNADEAEALARELLTQRLVAGVNMVPVNSLYWWEGAIQSRAEVLLMAHTRAAVFERLQAAVVARHSYVTPEIVGVPVQHGLPAYMKWIDDEVNQA